MKSWKCSILVVSIFLVVLAACQQLQQHSFEDEAVLSVNIESCEVIKVEYSDSDNCNANQCEKEKDCVCSQTDKFIYWIGNGKKKFSLAFDDTSPLQKNCGKKEASKHKCKIKKNLTDGAVFDYMVVPINCESGVDPRIVIKPH